MAEVAQDQFLEIVRHQGHGVDDALHALEEHGLQVDQPGLQFRSPLLVPDLDRLFIVGQQDDEFADVLVDVLVSGMAGPAAEERDHGLLLRLEQGEFVDVAVVDVDELEQKLPLHDLTQGGTLLERAHFRLIGAEPLCLVESRAG